MSDRGETRFEGPAGGGWQAMPSRAAYPALASLGAVFSVRNGWLPIVAAAVTAARELAPEIEIWEVKQWHAALSIRAQNGNLASAEALYAAGLFSQYICEITGGRGDLMTTHDIEQILSPVGVAILMAEPYLFEREFVTREPGGRWPADPPLASERDELDDQSAGVLLTPRYPALLDGTDIRITASHFDLADAALAAIVALCRRGKNAGAEMPLTRLGWFEGRFVVDAGPDVMVGVSSFVAHMAARIGHFGSCRP